MAKEVKKPPDASQTAAEDKEEESDSEDIDEQEFEEFLDWRSKTAWKWQRKLSYTHYI